MTSLIRRNGALAPRTLSRDEWLTPFDRLFDDMFGKVNVIDNKDTVLIEAAIPGMHKDDVTVEVADGVLTIQGTSNQHTDVGNGQFVRREIKRSAFQRSFRLGENLDETAIKGSYDNGILTLTVPKVVPTADERVVRQIEIA